MSGLRQLHPDRSKQSPLGGNVQPTGAVYSTGCGPMREKQSAAALLLFSLYLKVTSNSDKAMVHLISLALRGKACVKKDQRIMI